MTDVRKRKDAPVLLEGKEEVNSLYDKCYKLVNKMKDSESWAWLCSALLLEETLNGNVWKKMGGSWDTPNHPHYALLRIVECSAQESPFSAYLTGPNVKLAASGFRWDFGPKDRGGHSCCFIRAKLQKDGKWVTLASNSGYQVNATFQFQDGDKTLVLPFVPRHENHFTVLMSRPSEEEGEPFSTHVDNYTMNGTVTVNRQSDEMACDYYMRRWYPVLLPDQKDRASTVRIRDLSKFSFDLSGISEKTTTSVFQSCTGLGSDVGLAASRKIDHIVASRFSVYSSYQETKDRRVYPWLQSDLQVGFTCMPQAWIHVVRQYFFVYCAEQEEENWTSASALLFADEWVKWYTTHVLFVLPVLLTAQVDWLRANPAPFKTFEVGAWFACMNKLKLVLDAEESRLLSFGIKDKSTLTGRRTSLVNLENAIYLLLQHRPSNIGNAAIPAAPPLQRSNEYALKGQPLWEQELLRVLFDTDLELSRPVETCQLYARALNEWLTRERGDNLFSLRRLPSTFLQASILAKLAVKMSWLHLFARKFRAMLELALAKPIESDAKLFFQPVFSVCCLMLQVTNAWHRENHLLTDEDAWVDDGKDQKGGTPLSTMRLLRHLVFEHAIPVYDLAGIIVHCHLVGYWQRQLPVDQTFDLNNSFPEEYIFPVVAEHSPTVPFPVPLAAQREALHNARVLVLPHYMRARETSVDDTPYDVPRDVKGLTKVNVFETVWESRETSLPIVTVTIPHDGKYHVVVDEDLKAEPLPDTMRKTLPRFMYTFEPKQTLPMNLDKDGPVRYLSHGSRQDPDHILRFCTRFNAAWVTGEAPTFDPQQHVVLVKFCAIQETPIKGWSPDTEDKKVELGFALYTYDWAPTRPPRMMLVHHPPVRVHTFFNVPWLKCDLRASRRSWLLTAAALKHIDADELEDLLLQLALDDSQDGRSHIPLNYLRAEKSTFTTESDKKEEQKLRESVPGLYIRSSLKEIDHQARFPAHLPKIAVTKDLPFSHLLAPETYGQMDKVRDLESIMSRMLQREGELNTNQLLLSGLCLLRLIEQEHYRSSFWFSSKLKVQSKRWMEKHEMDRMQPTTQRGKLVAGVGFVLTLLYSNPEDPIETALLTATGKWISWFLSEETQTVSESNPHWIPFAGRQIWRILLLLQASSSRQSKDLFCHVSLDEVAMEHTLTTLFAKQGCEFFGFSSLCMAEDLPTTIFVQQENLESKLFKPLSVPTVQTRSIVPRMTEHLLLEIDPLTVKVSKAWQVEEKARLPILSNLDWIQKVKQVEQAMARYIVNSLAFYKIPFRMLELPRGVRIDIWNRSLPSREMQVVARIVFSKMQARLYVPDRQEGVDKVYLFDPLRNAINQVKNPPWVYDWWAKMHSALCWPVVKEDKLQQPGLFMLGYGPTQTSLTEFVQPSFIFNEKEIDTFTGFTVNGLFDSLNVAPNTLLNPCCVVQLSIGTGGLFLDLNAPNLTEAAIWLGLHAALSSMSVATTRIYPMTLGLLRDIRMFNAAYDDVSIMYGYFLSKGCNVPYLEIMHDTTDIEKSIVADKWINGVTIGTFLWAKDMIVLGPKDIYLDSVPLDKSRALLTPEALHIKEDIRAKSYTGTLANLLRSVDDATSFLEYSLRASMRTEPPEYHTDWKVSNGLVDLRGKVESPLPNVLFQLATGKLVQSTQYDIVQEMADALLTKRDEESYCPPLFAPIMGSGKTHVMLPLLVLHLLHSFRRWPERKHTVLIVAPDHLTMSTFARVAAIVRTWHPGVPCTLFADTDEPKTALERDAKIRRLVSLQEKQIVRGNRILMRRVVVTSDLWLKMALANRSFRNNVSMESALGGCLVIMDEIDTMFHPLTSEYNVVESLGFGPHPIQSLLPTLPNVNMWYATLVTLFAARHFDALQDGNWFATKNKNLLMNLAEQCTPSFESFKTDPTFLALLDKLNKVATIISTSLRVNQHCGLVDKEEDHLLFMCAVPFVNGNYVPRARYVDPDVLALLTALCYIHKQRIMGHFPRDIDNRQMAKYALYQPSPAALIVTNAKTGKLGLSNELKTELLPEHQVQLYLIHVVLQNAFPFMLHWKNRSVPFSLMMHRKVAPFAVAMSGTADQIGKCLAKHGGTVSAKLAEIKTVSLTHVSADRSLSDLVKVLRERPAIQMLVDTGAVFREKTMMQTLAFLLTNSGRKSVVYFDSLNRHVLTKASLDEKQRVIRVALGQKTQDLFDRASQTLIFFDNQHIIGADIPNQAQSEFEILCTIVPGITRETELVQGMFRARALIRDKIKERKIGMNLFVLASDFQATYGTSRMNDLDRVMDAVHLVEARAQYTNELIDTVHQEGIEKLLQPDLEEREDAKRKQELEIISRSRSKQWAYILDTNDMKQYEETMLFATRIQRAQEDILVEKWAETSIEIDPYTVAEVMSESRLTWLRYLSRFPFVQSEPVAVGIESIRKTVGKIVSMSPEVLNLLHWASSDKDTFARFLVPRPARNSTRLQPAFAILFAKDDESDDFWLPLLMTASEMRVLQPRLQTSKNPKLCLTLLGEPRKDEPWRVTLIRIMFRVPISPSLMNACCARIVRSLRNEGSEVGTTNKLVSLVDIPTRLFAKDGSAGQLIQPGIRSFLPLALDIATAIGRMKKRYYDPDLAITLFIRDWSRTRQLVPIFAQDDARLAEYKRMESQIKEPVLRSWLWRRKHDPVEEQKQFERAMEQFQNATFQVTTREQLARLETEFAKSVNLEVYNLPLHERNVLENLLIKADAELKALEEADRKKSDLDQDPQFRQGIVKGIGTAVDMGNSFLSQVEADVRYAVDPSRQSIDIAIFIRMFWRQEEMVRVYIDCLLKKARGQDVLPHIKQLLADQMGDAKAVIKVGS